MGPFPELRSTVKEFFRGFSDSDAFETKGFSPISADMFDPVITAAPFRRLRGSLGAASSISYSDEVVNTRTALSVSTVWAATRMISECFGMLTWMTQQEKNGELVSRSDLPIHNFFRWGNDDRDAMDIRSTWMQHLLHRGNAYGLITRRSGTGVALDIQMLLPDQVVVTREPKGDHRLMYEVSIPNERTRVYYVNAGQPHDVFHVRGLSYDGLVGYSVLSFAAQTFGNALGAQRNKGMFWKRGGRLPYTLKSSQKYAPADKKRFREDWEEIYNDPHRAPILEPGMEYQQIGVSAKDAQFLESNQFDVFDCCRFFNISPSLIGDLSKADYNSIFALADQFVKFTMSWWITRMEQSFHRCVLTPQERKAGIRAAHNLNRLQRGEFNQRMQGLATAISGSIMTTNEARRNEDLPPVDGGDEIRIQMQNVPISNTPSKPTPAQIQLEEEEDEA